MKTLLLAATLIVLASCSSSRIDRRIDDVAWDSLADESFLRWGETRLKSAEAKGLPVVQCYQGNAKETLVQYKKEFVTKEKSPYYWIHIGNCYFVQEAWQKAEFFYRMAMDEHKSPEMKALVLNNLGLISFKYEQWEKGKTYLEQAIALAPRYKVPRYNISQLYLQFGLYDRAIDVLSDKAFTGHKDIDVFFSLANAYLYRGELSRAAQYFRMIPSENFKREDIAATYSLYLIKIGKIQEASVIMKERDRSGVLELTLISQKIEKLLLQRMKGE